MDIVSFNQELMRRLKSGESLILSTSIPSEVVRKYPSEVAFLQYQINVATEQFNDKISQLKKSGEKKEEIVSLLLRIKKEKEKYE